MLSYPAIAENIEGEPLRYYVMSRSGEVRHLVDLGEWNGNGQCNCGNFAFRLAPMLKQGVEHGTATECWHIQQAKRHFCKRMIDAVLAQRGETNERTS